MRSWILTIVCVCLVACNFASATVLNVDFNAPSTATYNALGAAPDSGSNTFWNGVVLNSVASPGSFTTSANSLKYSNGTTTATGVSVTLSNGFNAGTISQGFVSSSILPLFIDYAYDTTNSNATFTGFSINGLNPAAVYDFYIYSMADYNGSGNNTVFTVNGVTSTVTGFPGSPDNLGTGFFQATTGATSNGNYLIYSNLSPVAGSISGTFNGTNERFNGFQLVEFVPEPSSLALVGLAAIGILRSSRGRRQHS